MKLIRKLGSPALAEKGLYVGYALRDSVGVFTTAFALLALLAISPPQAHAVEIQLVRLDSAVFRFKVPPTPGFPAGQDKTKNGSPNLSGDVDHTALGIDLSTVAPGISLVSALTYAVGNSSMNLTAGAELIAPVNFAFDAQGSIEIMAM